MPVFKAGCVLVDVKSKKIGLIYREKQKDYSFPKGHQEKGETLVECVIRETAEETKRDCKVLSKVPLGILRYVDSKGDRVQAEYFLAEDIGESENTSEDTHTLVWTNFDNVEETLSHQDLKELWNLIKDNVKEILK